MIERILAKILGVFDDFMEKLRMVYSVWWIISGNMYLLCVRIECVIITVKVVNKFFCGR